MASTRDLIVDDKIVVLVFGKFKTGKTWGALTFPRPNVIDFDHGMNTLLNPQFVAKYGLKHVEYFQPKRKLDTKTGIPLNYNAIDEACIYFDQWMKPGMVEKFDTWVLDSCTTLIDASMDKAIILLGDPTFKGAGSKTYEEAKAKGLVVPKKQDFGSERSMTEQFVRMIKESGKNVVVVCHEREITKDDGSVTAVVPLLTGKSQEDIPVMFDEVYRLTRIPKGEGYVSVLNTDPIGGARVGSRLGVPHGVAWEYDVLKSTVDGIRAKQRSLLAASPPLPAQAQTSQPQVPVGGL